MALTSWLVVGVLLLARRLQLLGERDRGSAVSGACPWLAHSSGFLPLTISVRLAQPPSGLSDVECPLLMPTFGHCLGSQDGNVFAACSSLPSSLVRSLD